MNALGTRAAFQIFIRHQLEVMIEEGKINFSNEEVKKFSNAIENDKFFYDSLGNFLAEYIKGYRVSDEI